MIVDQSIPDRAKSKIIKHPDPFKKRFIDLVDV